MGQNICAANGVRMKWRIQKAKQQLNTYSISFPYDDDEKNKSQIVNGY